VRQPDVKLHLFSQVLSGDAPHFKVMVARALKQELVDPV
jgi:hypothetical protein